MQPEPTEVTQKPSHDPASDTQHTIQYGYHDYRVPAASLLHGRDTAAGDSPTAARGNSASNGPTPHAPVQDSYQRQRRVSSTSSKSSRRTGSPVDRIIEHEEAVPTLSRRKNEGPTFSVTQPKNFGHPRLTLTDFPNGEPLQVITGITPS